LSRNHNRHAFRVFKPPAVPKIQIFGQNAPSYVKYTESIGLRRRRLTYAYTAVNYTVRLQGCYDSGLYENTTFLSQWTLTDTFTELKMVENLSLEFRCYSSQFRRYKCFRF